MTGREASIFACLTDVVVAPAGPLPAVRDTDAVSAFARYLDSCPRAGSLALRAALLGLEVAPRALGFGARMRRLDRGARERYLERLSKGRGEAVVKPLQALAQLFYYGDDRVMALSGYDPEPRLRRARELRRREARW